MPRLLKKTTHQVNEQEARWTGFLADSTVENARWLLHGNWDLRSKDLPSLVREAWNSCRTIVAPHSQELLHAIQEFQRSSRKEECHDLWGLIAIPEALAAKEKQLERIGDGVQIFPKERLHWPAAGYLNLYIRISDDYQMEIKRFSRCRYCEHSASLNPPWGSWYKALPIVEA